MKRSMMFLLSLSLAAPLPGCFYTGKEKDKKESAAIEEDETKKKGSKSKDKEDSEDDDKKSSKSKDEKSKKEDKDDEVDAKKILDEEGEDGSAVLDVKLPDDKKEAPSLGGGGGAAKVQTEPSLQWLPAGSLQVPNPGWKRIDDPPATVLLSPDKKAGIVFAGFTTTQDGSQKVDSIVKFFKLQNTKWKKPKQVTVGRDKVPALFGSGNAKGTDGKPVKVFFAMIKSGGESNLLAIGIADGDAPESTLKMGLDIVGSIKRR